MSNILAMKKPYEAVVKGDWEQFLQLFKEDRNKFNIFYPITVTEDTAFHIAVHSKRERPLKQLLELVHDTTVEHVFMANAYGNTVLHEAAISCNLPAVKLLTKYPVAPNQILKRNRSGQTPLFKAASFGGTKVVRYLASQPSQKTRDNTQLHKAHRKRKDGTSILHVAVRGEHYGTALELLKHDEGLAELKNKMGMTSLHLLANTELHAFSSIPVGDDNNDDATNIEDDDDVVDADNHSKKAHRGFTISRWKTVRKIWVVKRKRKFAFKLAGILINKDESWQQSLTEETEIMLDYVVSEADRDHSGQTSKLETRRILDVESEVDLDHSGQTSVAMAKETEIRLDVESRVDLDHSGQPKVETPLLAATRTGMTEIVEEILKEHPQAVEHTSHRKQNILHVAASYRRREIFELVKRMKIPASRLILGIDEDRYTVLHHVALTSNYTGGTTAGPAYQLNEELKWFKDVEDMMPSFFTQHCDNDNKTAKELFEDQHKEQLMDARKWIKETSQSCSAVAVLVATVVFAAAFTVPGGTDDENGLPILLKKPLFLFFTVADVVSLSCSLTSVVIFLSILTSPFQLDDFLVTLPRRLTLGFALLFMSVATTMLAFTSTIFLVIRLDQRQRWMMTLICCVALFPVSVLALTHFPLFVSFLSAWKSFFVVAWEILTSVKSLVAKNKIKS